MEVEDQLGAAFGAGAGQGCDGHVPEVPFGVEIAEEVEGVDGRDEAGDRDHGDLLEAGSRGEEAGGVAVDSLVHGARITPPRGGIVVVVEPGVETPVEGNLAMAQAILMVQRNSGSDVGQIGADERVIGERPDRFVTEDDGSRIVEAKHVDSGINGGITGSLREAPEDRVVPGVGVVGVSNKS